MCDSAVADSDKQMLPRQGLDTNQDDRIFAVVRFEIDVPNLPKYFFQNGGVLDAVVVGANLDISMSQSFHSDVHVVNFRQKNEVGIAVLELNPTYYVLDTNFKDVVNISEDAQVFASLSVETVTSQGGNCIAANGDGFGMLADVIAGQCTIVPLCFGDWEERVGTVVYQRITFHRVGSQESNVSKFISSAQNGTQAAWNQTMCGELRINWLPYKYMDPEQSDGAAYKETVDDLALEKSKPNNITLEDLLKLFVICSHQLRIPTYIAPPLEKYLSTHSRFYKHLNKLLQRKKLIYPHLPHLTKPEVSCHSGTSLLEAVLHSDMSLDADQFEDLMGVGLQMAILELNDGKQMSVRKAETCFLSETTREGERSRLWAKVAARAINHVVRMCCDYHTDGRPVINPNGFTQFVEAEDWSAASRPERDILRESGDCDNSACLTMRILRRLGVSPYDGATQCNRAGLYATNSSVSHDREFKKKKHVYTLGIRNALAGYVGALCIVSAHSASGETSEGASANKTCMGHAVPMLFPLGLLVKAMSEKDCNGSSDLSIDLKRLTALVPDERVEIIREFSEDYAKAVRDLKSLLGQEAIQKQHGSPPGQGMSPLALDGTVTSSLELYITEKKVHIQRNKEEKMLRNALQKVGKVLGASIIDLVCMNEPGHGHGFYQDFVEITIPGPLGDAQSLRSTGHAAHTYTFTPVSKTAGSSTVSQKNAGVSAQLVHEGRFELVAQIPIDEAMGRVIDERKKMVVTHTIPPRKPSHIRHCMTKLEEVSIMLCRQSLENLKIGLGKLDHEYENKNQTDQFIDVSYVISPRHILGNPNTIACDCAKYLKNAVNGSVEIFEFQSLLPTVFCAIVTITVCVK